MTKWVLVFWVITNGDTVIDKIDGFWSQEECTDAAVSLTERNPHETMVPNYAVITRCVEARK